MAQAYEAARTAYLQRLITSLSVVEDAITGNKLRLKEGEAIYIGLAKHKRPKKETEGIYQPPGYDKVKSMKVRARRSA